uniref:MADF domain-containing protein n=1 Tax=Heterorhabditis bacteriophora TaxID=37862 RepID=A0A1I7XPX7_HETBA
MHAEQWDPHPGQVLQQAIPVQVQQTQSNGALVTDEIRFSIIDSIYLRPGIWDSQREKTIGPSRKELFVEVTGLINQQHRIEPELTPEEVEKQWKNLKDTYMKTRKRVTFNNDGVLIPPKWKFYNSLMFLEELFGNQRGGKRRLDEVAGPSQAADVSVNQTKRLRTDEDSEEDEYMAFCEYFENFSGRSLLYPLRDIGYKDRVQFLKVQKSIRDLLHETQMEMLLSHMR